MNDAPHKAEVIREISWQEFHEAGMMWFINRILHTFGLVIVREIDDKTGAVRVYPARTVWRGFRPEDEERGFKRVAEYMKAGTGTDDADSTWSPTPTDTGPLDLFIRVSKLAAKRYLV